MIRRMLPIWPYRDLLKNPIRVDLLLKNRGSVLGFLRSLMR